MSWCTLKSFKFDNENFDMECFQAMLDQQTEEDVEVIAKLVFKVSFEKVLRRCGRFLTKLVIHVCKVRMDRKIIDMLIQECRNLRYLDICFQSFSYDVNDEDLIDLLSPMQKLEHLAIKISDRLNTTFLYILPCESIKELRLHQPISVPFYKVCHVSMSYCVVLFLIKILLIVIHIYF